MVVRRSRGGAYVLRDTTRDEISQRVPASQLKLISYEGNLLPICSKLRRLLATLAQPMTASTWSARSTSPHSTTLGSLPGTLSRWGASPSIGAGSGRLP